jgi:hypothetical protein
MTLRRIVSCALALVALVVTGVALCGCSKPLLSPTDERSPFDRYDALRAQHAPQYVEDEFGREQPNLRARLTPRN